MLLKHYLDRGSHLREHDPNRHAASEREHRKQKAGMQCIVGARSCVQELLKWRQFTTRLAADEQLLLVSDSLGTSSTHAP